MGEWIEQGTGAMNEVLHGAHGFYEEGMLEGYQYSRLGGERIAPEPQQLIIASSPLLGCIDCVVSVADVAVEHIRISARIDRPGFELCEVWRGECRAVQGKVVAFTGQALLEGLHHRRNIGEWDVLQEQLLAMLEHPYCRAMDALGCGVYTVIMFSRYLTMNYPFIYWLILLNDVRWQPPEDHDVITRQMLADALSVDHLSNGQMKALRKLDVWRQMSRPTLQAALLMIARDWDTWRPLVAHSDTICPVILQAAALLMSMQPELVHARWFTFDQLQLWMDNWSQLRPEADVAEESDAEGADIEQGICELYLLCNIVIHTVPEAFEWADAEGTRRNTAGLMQLQDIAAVERKAREAAKECLAAFRRIDDDPYHFFGLAAVFFEPWLVKLGEKLEHYFQDFIHSSWRMLFERTLCDFADRIYNNDKISEKYVDDVLLCKMSGLVGDDKFSQIMTAGHLREVANLLRNCAASRVHAAVVGDSEFWQYRNENTRENALLQIDKRENSNDFFVVEFNGFSNRGVSTAAQTHLKEWLFQSCRTCCSPYEVRRYCAHRGDCIVVGRSSALLIDEARSNGG